MGKSFTSADTLKNVCDNPKKLSKFLEQRAVNHKGYYQYTTLDALRGMKETGTLFLTRSDCLNDGMEFDGVVQRQQFYIASFCAKQKESVAMWALYSTPNEKGIRINFSRATMIKISGEQPNKMEVFKVGEGNKVLFENRLTIDNAYLTDVVYLDKETSLLRWRRDNANIDIKNVQNEIFLGRIKDSMWDYESEVRLLVKLKGGEQDFPKRIALKVENLLDNAIILKSPGFREENNKNRLYKELFKTISFQKNRFCGKVVFPTCGSCRWCK